MTISLTSGKWSKIHIKIQFVRFKQKNFRTPIIKYTFERNYARDMKSDSFVKQIFILVSFLIPFSFVCAQENVNRIESFEDSLMDETLLPQVVVTDSVKSAKMIIMKMIENKKKISVV